MAALPLVWVHAASVGETNAVVPLIERILEVLALGDDWVEIAIWNPDGSRSEMSGNGTRIRLDLCLQITTQHPDTKVVLLTVYDDEHYLYQALRVGASGYILKRIDG